MTVTQLIAAPPVVIAAPDLPAGHGPGTVWPWDPNAVFFSVVIPFFNPGRVLRETVERLTELLRAQSIDFEIIAVSGGSTDGSAGTLKGILGARVIDSPHIQDKGAALHVGFAAARGAWIGFIDVDADAGADPAELIECLHRAREDRHVSV